MDRRTYLKHNGIVIAGIFFSGGLISFMQSCKTDQTSGSGLKLLNEKEARLLAALSDMIIPRTDTPGASDVGVEKRIDEALYFNFESEDQHSFVEGLNMIEEYAIKTQGDSFIGLNMAGKKSVMNYAIQDSIKHKSEYTKHVYPMIKGLTIIAYFTAETIAKNLLKYDPIPGVFRGDIPYSEVNGIWTIDILDS